MGCAESKAAKRRQKARALNIADDDDDVAETAYKVVIIGSKAVGKSSLVLRITKDRFAETHNVTIGAAFSAKVLKLSNGHEVKLHIWDTAGEEMYRAMTRSFYRGADGCIICYDITDRSTFDGLKQWVADFRDECPDAALMLCGNKSDLISRRKVTKQQCEELAATLGSRIIGVQEASAKTNVGVEELFQTMASSLHATGHRQS